MCKISDLETIPSEQDTIDVINTDDCILLSEETIAVRSALFDIYSIGKQMLCCDEIQRSALALQKREMISQLENALFKFPQIDIPVKHYFAKGLYAREIFAKAGTLMTGKIHKHEHLNILLKGEVHLISEDADLVVSAPATFTASAGVKKVGYFMKDSIFMNVTATDVTDSDLLLKELCVDNYSDLFQEEVF